VGATLEEAIGTIKQNFHAFGTWMQIICAWQTVQPKRGTRLLTMVTILVYTMTLFALRERFEA
jgi:hypothetical protein